MVLSDWWAKVGVPGAELGVPMGVPLGVPFIGRVALLLRDRVGAVVFIEIAALRPGERGGRWLVSSLGTSCCFPAGVAALFQGLPWLLTRRQSALLVSSGFTINALEDLNFDNLNMLPELLRGSYNNRKYYEQKQY